MNSKKDYIFLGFFAIFFLVALAFLGSIFVYIGFLLGGALGTIVSLICVGSAEPGIYPGFVVGALSGLACFIFTVLKHSIPLIDTIIDRYSYKE